MGQGESKEGEGDSQPVKTCYYELLGIEKDASAADIDRAYKKAALKWHPDKNRNEDTTEKFQACQEAYSVLSDPHERAWYDEHRDQILKGVNPEDAKEEDSSYITPSDLIPFINPGCYPGKFDMSKERNFYQVYNELFRRVDKEEEQEEDVTKDHHDAPAFGDADTYIGDVLAFYKHWEVFGTLKTFSYTDKYDTNKASFSREKRYMANENKRERQKEKVKFNQTVRELLEFVRKRDPRYQSHIEQKEAEKQRKKDEQAEKKRKAAEEQQKRLEEYRERIRKEHEELEGEGEGEEEIVIEKQFVCELCTKYSKTKNTQFKTEGAFKTHLNSKKHKQTVAKFGGKLAETILEQEAEQKLTELDEKVKKAQEQEEEDKKEEIYDEYVKEEEERENEKLRKKQEKKKRKEEKRRQKQKQHKHPQSGTESDDEEPTKNPVKEPTKDLPPKEPEDSESENSDKDQENDGNSDDGQEGDESESSEEYVSKNKLKKMNKKSKGKGKKDDQPPVLAKLQGKNKKSKNKKRKQFYENQVKASDPTDATNSDHSDTEEVKQAPDDTTAPVKPPTEASDQQTQPKKKRRRAKKDKNEAADPSNPTAPGASGTTSKGGITCRVCSQQFGSKSKLFKHIKDTGHATAK